MAPFGIASHLAAAGLYGLLVLWQLRHWRGEARSWPLIIALAAVALWALVAGLLGPFDMLTGLTDGARSLAFLTFMYGLVEREAGDRRLRPVKAVYASVAGVIGLQIMLSALLPRFANEPVIVAALVSTGQMIGLAVAAGALVLVHNVYGQAAAESRGAIRLPMIALAVMWAYDLNLATAGYLSRAAPDTLYAARGLVLALLAPVFALGMRRPGRLRVQLSRVATFQSLSLLAILAYLLVMMSVSRAAELVGGNWAATAGLALVAAMSAAALIVLPSARARRWLRVTVQKHLFRHRYDYRQEWLRFTATIGGDAPLEQRVVKAMADIGEAPGGLLLLRDGADRLRPGGRWNFPPAGGPGDEPCAALIGWLEETGYILAFDQSRAAGGMTLPASLAALPDAWAGIPLIHAGRLLGLVVIAHPPVRRALDWEDFDLFRAAGRQAASYLAEAHSLEALAQARRFDEFNRRFAFILHDIKNLVSQLSLVARNARRHADNPEFRADMVATLDSSVRKMNDLLARLAPGAKGRSELCPRAVKLRPLLAGLAKAKERQHPVTVGEGDTTVLADPAALEQALGHLVQNAIDASPADAPIALSVAAQGDHAVVEVADQGCGMSSEFVETRLFQPFVSTKDGGFGIGAHEARALVEAMGGRLDVESRPGAGTRFMLHLPMAAAVAAHQPERISA